MFFEIPSLLRPDKAGRLTALAETLSLVDGRVANQGKLDEAQSSSRPAEPKPAKLFRIRRIVSEALGRSREFREFAFPI